VFRALLHIFRRSVGIALANDEVGQANPRSG
jgi:hypothetical protein